MKEQTLEESRVIIDKLDKEICALLVQRMDTVQQVAAYKLAHDLPVFQPERELKVLDKVSALAGEQYGPAVAAVYRCLMDESKKLQEAWLAQQRQD